MKDYIDVEIFPTGPIFIEGQECCENLTKSLNDDLSDWTIVKVPIKHEFIDDLTEVITYEYRYRLYLSKLYKMLGYNAIIANRYSGYYWEKDKDGNMTDVYLP